MTPKSLALRYVTNKNNFYLSERHLAKVFAKSRFSIGRKDVRRLMNYFVKAGIISYFSYSNGVGFTIGKRNNYNRMYFIAKNMLSDKDIQFSHNSIRYYTE